MRRRRLLAPVTQMRRAYDHRTPRKFKRCKQMSKQMYLNISFFFQMCRARLPRCLYEVDAFHGLRSQRNGLNERGD